MTDGGTRAAEPVRVVLCTSGGVFGAIVLRRLLACPALQVAGLVLSSRVLRAEYSWWRGAREQIRTSGVRYALYLWSATGLADVIGRFAPGGSAASLAAAHGIPLFVTRNVNGAAGRDFIATRAPQLLLSAFFNQRLQATIYGLPPLGAINIHPSLLPDFRGVDPVFFARLRGAARLGVTVHRIDASLDTGAILAQVEHRCGGGDSVLRITAELYALGAGLVTARWPDFIRPERGVPQTGAGGYDSWPASRDVTALLRRGDRLVHLRDLRDLLRGTLGSGRTA